MIKPSHLIAICAAAFLTFIVFFMPASSLVSFAKLPDGLAYGGAEGSIWNMRLTNVAFRGRPIGNIRIQTDLGIFLGLLGGSAQIEGPAMNASFEFSEGAGLTVSNLEATTELRGRFASQAYSGAVRVTNAEAEFDSRGLCLLADGELRTNAFEDMFAALGMARDVVQAPLVCSDGFLSVDFSRAFAGGTLEATAKLQHADGVVLTVLLRFDDQAAIPEQIIGWLETNGFAATADGWRTSSRLTL